MPCLRQPPARLAIGFAVPAAGRMGRIPKQLVKTPKRRLWSVRGSLGPVRQLAGHADEFTAEGGNTANSLADKETGAAKQDEGARDGNTGRSRADPCTRQSRERTPKATPSHAVRPTSRGSRSPQDTILGPPAQRALRQSRHNHGGDGDSRNAQAGC